MDVIDFRKAAFYFKILFLRCFNALFKISNISTEI